MGAAKIGDVAQGDVPAVDMLFPEIAVDDGGWRGLLPVILINIDALAEEPRLSSGSADRSDRSAPR